MNTDLATIGLCLLLGMGWSVAAPAAPTASLSLPEAVARVLADNPQFYVYRLRQEALAGALSSAALRPALEIDAEVENFAGTGDLRDLSSSEWTLSLSRVIERGDKRQARTGVVRRRQALADAERQVVELNLLSDVTAAYTELAAAEAQVELREQSAELAQTLREAIADRVAAGRTAQAELASAGAALAEANLAVTDAEFNVAATRVRLAALWGEFDASAFATTADLMNLPTLPPVAELIARLKESPALEVFTSEARLREAEVSLARAQQAADYTLGGGIKHHSDRGDSAFVMRFSMPLGSERRAQGEITAAQANLLRVDAERQTALWQMQGRLLALDFQRRAAVTRVRSLQESVIPQLQQAYTATREAFDSGLYGFIELSAAQRTLIDGRIALVEAATQAHLLRTEIERLSGESFISEDVTNGDQQ